MTRKFLCLMLVALLAVAALPALALAESASVKLPYADGSLVVREGPGTSFDPATWVRNGESIEVLSWGETWSKIKVDRNGKVGYVKNYYITGEAPKPDPKPHGSKYSIGRVSTRYASSYVNLRKGAGTGYEVVGSAKCGTRLSIYGESGNWYLVETSGGVSGYISKSYVAMGVSGKATAGVNMRKGAGTGYRVIKTLSTGASLTVLGVNGNWIKVKAGGDTGYIYYKYYKFT